MGIALIIFTLLMSFLLLPVSLKSGETEDERRELMKTLQKIEKDYHDYPVEIQERQRKVIRAHRGVFRWWYVSMAIYLAYFIILYRIFKTGLRGADLDLLYNWVPTPKQPLNLVFLGKIDMVKPNPLLNTVSAGLTFVAEGLSIWFSPHPATREDWLMLILAPLAAYFITMRIPSGQELFFTVSLLFVIFLMVTREVRSVWKLQQVRKAKEKVVYGKVIR